jgi:hypothetical protein
MALGDIFGGLGMGLGAAAQGYQQGQVKGEAEIYRRQQAAQDREYKKQILAAKKKEVDPNEKIRQQAGRTAQMILRMRANPADQGYFESPQGQEFAKRMEEIGNRLWGVHIGTIEPDDVDTYALSFAPVNNARPGEETAESLPGKLPFLREPGSTQAPPMGDLGGREPMPDQWAGGANIPLDAPPGAPMPPRLGPPDIGPAPAPKPPPPKPPTPEERYWAHVNNPPKVEPMRGERPKDTEARRRALMTEHDRQTNLLYQSVTLGDKARKAGADATIAESDASVRPEMNRQKPIKGIVDIQKGRADRDLAIATTPIKVKQGQVAVKKAEQEVKLAPKRLKVQEEGLKHRKEIDWAKLRQQDRQFQARETRQDRAMSAKGSGEELRALKEVLTKKFSAYQKSESFGPFRESRFAVQGADREKLGREIDGLQKRIMAIANRKPVAPESASTSSRVTTSKVARVKGGPLGKPAPAVKAKMPKGVSDREYKAVAGLIGKGTFDNFARGLQGTDRARAKAIYKQKTGRDWGG